MSRGPIVVKVGGSLFDLPDLGQRLHAWLAAQGHARMLLVPGGGPTADLIRAFDRRYGLGEEAAHWLALRAMALNAWILAALLPIPLPGGPKPCTYYSGPARKNRAGAHREKSEAEVQGRGRPRCTIYRTAHLWRRCVGPSQVALVDRFPSLPVADTIRGTVLRRAQPSRLFSTQETPMRWLPFRFAPFRSFRLFLPAGKRPWRARNRRPKTARLAVEALESRCLLSATLVKDINTTIGSSILLPEFTESNGTAFFLADDGIHGRELCKSDGTAHGTHLVKDINRGPGNAFNVFPADLTDVNGTLFFPANDGIHGYQLWKSDGTAAGTVMLTDLNPTGAVLGPYYLTNVNGTLYFSISSGPADIQPRSARGHGECERHAFLHWLRYPGGAMEERRHRRRHGVP
jgi:ELWxxDGT repeat protein